MSQGGRLSPYWSARDIMDPKGNSESISLRLPRNGSPPGSGIGTVSDMLCMCMSVCVM